MVSNITSVILTNTYCIVSNTKKKKITLTLRQTFTHQKGTFVKSVFQGTFSCTVPWMPLSPSVAISSKVLPL